MTAADLSSQLAQAQSDIRALSDLSPAALQLARSRYLKVESA